MSYQYYRRQGIFPTYADLKTLEGYTELREKMFFRLKFLPEMFKDKTLAEFGPDTGENALVFQRWGAELTLIEPNTKAHAVILDYFRKFGHLPKLSDGDFLGFDGLFDIVCAEGFIYTLSLEDWTRKAAELVKSGGFLIVNYYEKHGSAMEFLTKKIYERVSAVKGRILETAKELFLPKWNLIPHTRSFEAWWMDVLENPFVKEENCIDYHDLVSQLQDFKLYSSWPNYIDSRGWIKSDEDTLLELKQQEIAFNLPDDIEQLIRFCRTDHRFLVNWGQPNHYAIFKKI